MARSHSCSYPPANYGHIVRLQAQYWTPLIQWVEVGVAYTCPLLPMGATVSHAVPATFSARSSL